MLYTDKDIENFYRALMRDCQAVISLKDTKFEDMHAIDDAEHVLDYINADLPGNIKSMVMRVNEVSDEPDFFLICVILQALRKYIQTLDEVPANAAAMLEFLNEYDLGDLARKVRDTVPAVKKEIYLR